MDTEPFMQGMLAGIVVCIFVLASLAALAELLSRSAGQPFDGRAKKRTYGRIPPIGGSGTAPPTKPPRGASPSVPYQPLPPLGGSGIMRLSDCDCDGCRAHRRFVSGT